MIDSEQGLWRTTGKIYSTYIRKFNELTMIQTQPGVRNLLYPIIDFQLIIETQN
jgi:hypothetical protein